MSLWFPANINVTAAGDETKDLELTNQWYANQHYIISNLMLPCDLSNVLLYKWKERSDCYWSLSPKKSPGHSPVNLQKLKCPILHSSATSPWIWKKILMFFFSFVCFSLFAPAVIAVAAPARFSTGKMTFFFFSYFYLHYCKIFIPKLYVNAVYQRSIHLYAHEPALSNPLI